MLEKKENIMEMNKLLKKFRNPFPLPRFTSGRILVIYNYHESPAAIKNASHFVKYGMAKDDRVDFHIATNSKKRTVKFPSYSTIHYRNSSEYKAWGGWQMVLSRLRIKKYKYFILIKDTAIGPHVDYSGTRWIYQFISMINDRDRLVGATLNTSQQKNWSPHVQAYFLCTDLTGLMSMINNKVFNLGNLLKGDTGEIVTSKCILKRGYNIACRIPKLHGIDFRMKNIHTLTRFVYMKDPYAPGSKTNVDFRQVIFMRRK